MLVNKSCGNKGMGVTGLWLGTSPLVTDTGEAGLDEMMMSSSKGGAPSSLGLGLADPPTFTISDIEELTNMLKDFLQGGVAVSEHFDCFHINFSVVWGRGFERKFTLTKTVFRGMGVAVDSNKTVK